MMIRPATDGTTLHTVAQGAALIEDLLTIMIGMEPTHTICIGA